MKRATLVAVGAFVLLLVAFLATREKQVQVGVHKLELPVFDKSKVSEIDFGGAHRATLRREGEGWVVEDPDKPGPHPADEGQVRSFLEELSRPKLSDIVTDRVDRQAELEIDEAKGTTVKVVAGLAKPIELVFGRAARGGNYVRLPGRPEVFLATGRLGNQARRGASAWRKHGVLSVQAGDIVSIDVKPVAGTSFSLARGTGDQWQLANAPAGFRLDANAGQQLAQQLAGVSAQDFLEPGQTDASLGLQGPHDVVEAKLKDGRAVVLHFAHAAATDAGTPASGPVALRVEGDPQLYQVAAYSRNAIVKPIDELRDLSLLQLDPAKVTAVTLRGQKPVSLQKDGASWKVLTPKQLPAGLEFDPRQVLAQLNRLKTLRAASWPHQRVAEKAAGLAATPLVELTLADGTKQALRFGKAVEGGTGPKQVYVQGSADKVVYAIGESEKTHLETGIELFKKPPPPPSLDKIKGLSSLPPDIRRQLETQLKQRAAEN